MKRLSLFFLLALGLGVINLADAQNKNVHCLVLDKTMSMTGSGGSDNIWSDVQEYCYGWIDGLDLNSTVLFFTYDDKLYGPATFEIGSDADKEKVKGAVRNVVVDGRHTFIASNLKKVKDYAFAHYPKENKKIYLITDGKEEQPGSNFVGVLNDFDASCSEYDHLYYVDLNGKADPNVINAIEQSEHSDHGKGFVTYIEIAPEWNMLSYNIGDKVQLEQRFNVLQLREIPSDLKFSFRVDSLAYVGEATGTANVAFNPSTLSFDEMTKIEDGKYSAKVNMSFLNNSAQECDIYVKIEGQSLKDDDDVYQVVANPAGFVIKARNKEKPSVVIVGGGWN